MTQDEIIEMARQAGLPEAIIEMTPIAFERFAKLVAEKVNADWSETNERLIKVFNEKADLAYLSGAKEEREACANIVEENANKCGVDTVAWMLLASNAEAIRARGQA